MKIRNVENLVNVTLDMSFEDAVKVQKFAPESMLLTNDNGDQLFKVKVCPNHGLFATFMGEIGDFGAEFTEVREAPTIWFGMADVPKEKVEATILEDFGMTLAKIKKVEAQMLEALKGVETEVASVQNSIAVL